MATKAPSKKIENVFNSIEDTLVDPVKKNVVTVEDGAPDVTDEKWHEYVMSFFTEDELIEGKPVVAGLRRVTQLVVGKIVSSLPSQIFPPKEDNSIGRATVSWVVTLENGQIFGDVASSWEGNTDEMFCVYAVETAATRAEARALRKALCLKVVSADEISQNVKPLDVVKKLAKTVATEGEYDDQGRITDAQANFINSKAKKLNVNVAEFLEKEFNAPVAKKISKKVASNAIDKLNDYQQNPSAIPEEIKGYLENWL
jgi:hypothetical protein